jgi:hypothetical protein
MSELGATAESSNNPSQQIVGGGKQGNGDANPPQEPGNLISPHAKNSTKTLGSRRDSQVNSGSDTDSQASSKRSSPFKITKVPSKKKAKIAFRRGKKRIADDVVTRFQFADCFGVGVKVLTRDTVETVLNMDCPSKPETPSEIKAVSEMCCYGGLDLPSHIHGAGGSDVTLGTKLVYSSMPISDNKGSITRFADHHDTKYNKKADPGGESKGGVSTEMDTAKIGVMARQLGLGVNVKVDLEDTPDEVHEGWKRKLLEAHADTQKYSCGMDVAVFEENRLRWHVWNQVERLGLADKFTMPPRSKNFENLKRYIRAGKLKRAILQLDYEGMSYIEKKDNRKSNSLKGMVIEKYLGEEDDGFDSGVDSFQV